MAKNKNRTLHPDEPLRHTDHPRPVSRRDFIRQGFISGTGAVLAPTMLGALFGSSAAHALSTDMNDLKTACNIQPGAGKIPFICFDLAGGANFSGSNVLVGGQGGIEDSLTSAGYSKLGIPGDRLPDFGGAELFVDRSMGIPFHSQSSMLEGINMRFTNDSRVNGAIIPARSDNDTGNNPHNPMYGISKAGARGELLGLIGSRNSDSGGNSMAPASMIDLSVRPTKIDRPGDTKGLVDTGQLASKMGVENATRVMEAIQRISDAKLSNVNVQTKLNDVEQLSGKTYDELIKEQIKCGYVKSADMVEQFGDPTALDSSFSDPIISQIFTAGELADSGGDREFRKTAAVMKMVVSGYAGAGTITMGGYDYHTGNRTTGDARDVRAGQCIGACLEYARLLKQPLMIYVCSDGSLSSNGAVDPAPAANGKLVWTGDNSSTASSFFLVYNPDRLGGRPQLFTGDSLGDAAHQQLGWFRPDASVETNATPAANNVNLLVETVVLNYMALHGDVSGSDYISTFLSKFPNHGLGKDTMLKRMTAFNSLQNLNADGTVPPPV